MFDEYLQPYLYKSVRNLNHSTQFDFLNGLNQLNLSVNPELNNIYQKFQTTLLKLILENYLEKRYCE